MGITQGPGSLEDHFNTDSVGKLHLRCDVCGSERVASLFLLKVLDGPYIDHPGIQRRNVYRCDECGYAFVYPVLPKLYAAYYETLNGDYHNQHDEDISRYQGTLKNLDVSHIQKILDWGCGTGTFLSTLPPSVEKWGVEASRSAAEVARRKGIRTLSPSEAQICDLKSSFDAITAIDVVEHIADLSSLKSTFSALLRPGGTLVLLTGDLESSAAQRAGRYWYYMQHAEHISFLSARSIRRWLESEFEDIRVVPMSHHENGLTTSTYLNLLFSLRWLLEAGGLGNVLRCSAMRFVKNDHMLVSARKRGK